MGTEFVIFRKDVKPPVEVDEEGIVSNLDNYEKHIHYVTIAKRNSGYNSLNYEVLLSLIDPETPVYPIDNTPQGIYTLYDLSEDNI